MSDGAGIRDLHEVNDNIEAIGIERMVSQMKQADCILLSVDASMGWTAVVLALYLAILGLLSLNGLHRAWLLWEWLRRGPPAPPAPPAEWPFVTVQLPLFNEPLVVERLIDACAKLDYRTDLFEIQVLDDSTDATTGLARAEIGRAHV